MPPSSLTLNYDALLSTTLFNYRRKFEDAISTANAFYFLLKREGAIKTKDNIGERAQIALMYELGQADSYSGYDQLDTTPMDGITSAFFDWRQAAVPIAISGKEEKQNRSEAQLIDLLEGKTKQAEMGIVEFFNKRLLQGAGGTSITSAYTSSINGSSFIDPLPKLVAYDPTASVVVGNINQSTYTWWRNKTKNSTSTTYAGLRKDLRNLYNTCSLGPGGSPNLHIADQAVFEVYVAALEAMHQNPSYQKADLPFDTVAFNGQPVVHDEFVPDVQGGSATQSTTSGTWWMLNTKFFEVQVQADSNFAPTPFQKPVGQDAKVAHILWMGAALCSNRRKQGVAGGIDTTIAS
ncbi:MAG TPA: phage major capsid protein [Vicinamibacterales bacterium]|nr:phage major capsid protein [Vicinamibacterales bacterium]